MLSMDTHFVSCVPATIKVEQMRTIKNLIEVRIPDEELANANLKDGLKINVKSEKPFVVNAFWIVNILDIHKEIEKDWTTLHDELFKGNFLSHKRESLFKSERRIYDSSLEQVQCEIRPPDEMDVAKIPSPTPRDFYPLVIIVTCLEDKSSESSSSSCAAATIHLVHIKDSIVPVKSHVIKQYIKQTDGRILDISQVYAEESAACFICFEEASNEEGIKLFCLLPCRHSPICSSCIPRIRDCPKCRCPIASVFDVNAPQMDESVGSTRPTIDPSVSHLYDNDGPSIERNKNKFLSSIKSIFGL